MMKFDIFNGNRTTKTVVFTVLLVLTVVWMMVIFGFSSSNAEDSTVQSNRITEFLVRIFVPGYDELTEEQMQELVLQYDGTVRKLAHFAFYAILGALSCATATTQPFMNVEKYYCLPLISVSTSIVFALSDEYHQTFVDGRAGQVKDIIIDSAGIVCGTVVMIAVFFCLVKIFNENNTKEA